ncbi:ATP-binding protein [Streptomyces xinghaiensis]|uniref:ATP-binding protein n=1 Tax=Streptomyces xinghaiensis TaxID=1038928 RepID=UPI0012FF870F|nr:hypothetical protein [Streptomyces sp. SID5475]
MTEPRLSRSGTRSVLTFAAEAVQLRDLRAAVKVQLAQWQVPTLAAEAQLVVTELVTNVVKHVGEGSTVRFVLALDPDRLRIELHDKSPVLPVSRRADCDSECGRGLHLVAVMAADSGANPTAEGKVVWCELQAAGARTPVGDGPAAAGSCGATPARRSV